MTTNSAIKRLIRLKPDIFKPSTVRSMVDPDGGLAAYQTENATFFLTSAIGETGSFRYDPIGSGIKSTQQLNVNWSQFENHVFFNSAQVKVNAAFNKIIDRYPFDGTRKELELFFDGMTGYENYVYQQMPKNKGYLFFSGSNIGDTTSKGTYITVVDSAGSTFPFLTKNPNGAARIDPTTSSISFQFQIYAPPITNNNQIIFQKLNTLSSTEQYGFGCYLSKSLSTSTAQLTFFVCSGSTNYMTASINLVKNNWAPITFVWDRASSINQIKGYVSGVLVATSSQVTISNLDFQSSSFFIGSGSNIVKPFFEPVTTFSGGLDELRYYKKSLAPSEITQYQSSSIYSSDELSLYFKFNEPSGSNTNLVIDSSGKGMHGTLNSYASSLIKVRNYATSSLFGESPMIYEDIKECPILFPDHPGVEILRNSLLTDAASYDVENPNLITKLVPKQYFYYGQQQAGFSSEEGELNNLQYQSEPNTVSLGSTQTIMSLLYMWASFFDEIKIFIDAFSTIRHVDYQTHDTVPDAFLTQLASFYGLELPPIFIGSTIEQFINGKNITTDIVNSEFALQYLQNQIWRRILINANDILKSKGTIHSIKALLRAVGIEGDNIFRFKEYGGPTQRTFAALRETRNDLSTMLNFKNGGYIKSSFLSGSRIEPGLPQPVGTFIYNNQNHNIGTSNVSDGLFTSGSWTYEGIYGYSGLPTNTLTQSLVRLMVSGSNNKENILANLYAISGSGVKLFLNPNYFSSLNALTMSLTTPNIFDGQLWNISFGRNRSDLIGKVSSSYFLRAARNNLGEIIEEYVTSSYFDDNFINNFDKNLFQKIDNTYNISGSFLAIGSGSTTISQSNDFVNQQNVQFFDGEVSQIRFWTKGLSINEWREHVRNYKSLGVEDPRVNFNFENMRSGSFEKIRIDLSTDQEILTTDNSGKIQIFDFSQNNLHASGTLFPITASVIIPRRFYYSYISPNFDEAVTSNKVRVRSYQNLDEILNDEGMYSLQAPLYELQQEQIPEDNGKFSIDFSIMDSINQDMMSLFSSLEIFDNILGSPSMMFSSDYPDLEVLQNIYFNRLENKINIRSFFDFYKWFNTNIGKIIEQLVPRKTKYNGINYVIQSHLLERPKVEYHFEDIYVGNNTAQRTFEDY